MITKSKVYLSNINTSNLRPQNTHIWSKSDLFRKFLCLTVYNRDTSILFAQQEPKIAIYREQLCDNKHLRYDGVLVL